MYKIKLILSIDISALETSIDVDIAKTLKKAFQNDPEHGTSSFFFDYLSFSKKPNENYSKITEGA